ncbi:hypothetical protein QCE47_20150 [Caballeronia sp. LZ025]|uniref:hypothetical protein n=1 Tax=Caballeronia TaxID=1827195 RepID=UPI001FD55DCE|nr:MULTISPECIES: hypothetical protein [Caballeronia]MDR5734626.1 hypothetical protein [Caballeronia sp. LZ025]
MKTLHPDNELAAEYSAKAWPANPQLTLAVMAMARDASDESVSGQDAELVVADSASGAVIAHFYQRDAIVEQGMAFTDIALDTARYDISPAIRAFGVRVSYRGLSRVAPSGEISLRLYVLENETLRPVLDGLAVEQANGEWDDRCEGFYDSTKRTIATGPAGREGYASLKVTEKTVRSVTRMVKDECVNRDGAPKQKEFTLEYRDGKYSVPQGLRLQG